MGIGNRAKRAISAALLVTVAGALVAVPALAQYEPTTTTTRPTTTTTRPTTTTTAPTTTSTTRPTTTTVTIPDDDDEQPSQEPNIQPAAVADKIIQPGGATAVSASFTGNDDPPPPAGTEVAIQVAPGTGGAPVFNATATVNQDGSVTLDVSVPAGSPSGVYMVTVVLPSIEGRRPQVRVAFLVVKSTVSAAGFDVGAAAPPTTLDPEVEAAMAKSHTPAVDAAIAEIQGQLRRVEENVVVEAIVGGAELSLDGARLLLDGVPLVAGPDADGSERGLVAALALGTAAAGLFVLRRRTSLAGAR